MIWSRPFPSSCFSSCFCLNGSHGHRRGGCRAPTAPRVGRGQAQSSHPGYALPSILLPPQLFALEEAITVYTHIPFLGSPPYPGIRVILSVPTLPSLPVFP